MGRGGEEGHWDEPPPPPTFTLSGPGPFTSTQATLSLPSSTTVGTGKSNDSRPYSRSNVKGSAPLNQTESREGPQVVSLPKGAFLKEAFRETEPFRRLQWPDQAAPPSSVGHLSHCTGCRGHGRSDPNSLPGKSCSFPHLDTPPAGEGSRGKSQGRRRGLTVPSGWPPSSAVSLPRSRSAQQ